LKNAYSTFRASKFYKNLFSLSVSQLGNYLIPLLVMPYLTRALGPAKFGLITFAQVFISYFTLVVNYGFDYTVTRSVAAHRNDAAKLSSIFCQVLYAKLLLFAVSTVVLICLLQIPRFGQLSVLLLTTHLINIGFIFYPSWFFQGMQDLKIIAILSFLIKLLYAILIVVFIHNDQDFLLNNLFLSISQIAISAISVYIAVKRYDIKMCRPDKSAMLSILADGRFFFFSTLVVNFYTYTNTFLLGLFSTQEETAYFNVVYRIIFAIQGLLLVPFNLAFFPVISSSFSNNMFSESNKKLMRAAALILLATFLCGVVLYFAAPDIILLLFGNKFLNSVNLLRFLAFIPMLMGLVNVFGFNGLMSLHQDKTFLAITFIGGTFSIILNIILIPRLKSFGVAGVWIATELLIGSLCFFYYRKTLKKQLL